MTRARRLLALLLVLILGVGAVACGSDSDSDQGDSTEASQAAEVEGKTWTLMNVATQDSASSLPNTVEAPTLKFEDGSVEVFTGCNSGSGDAQIGESEIDFGSISLTEKACVGLGSHVEAFVTEVLGGEVRYRINQGNLVLEGDQISLIYSSN